MLTELYPIPMVDRTFQNIGVTKNTGIYCENPQKLYRLVFSNVTISILYIYYCFHSINKIKMQIYLFMLAYFYQDRQN